MEGFEQFQHGILEAAKAYILPLMEGEQKTAFGEAMKNHLLDLDGPTELPSKDADSKHTEREIYFFRLFYGFLEIAGSLEMLEAIAILIGSFPFRDTRITKERYLQFQIEGYLAEVYLLGQRLQSYLRLVERQHRRDRKLARIKTLSGILSTTIKNALEGVIRTRDSHVHEARFKHKDLDRLRGIGLLARNGNDEVAKAMQVFYQYEYAQIRKKWKNTLAENNKAIRKLLDVFFEGLCAVIFDPKTNALDYPSRLKL